MTPSTHRRYLDDIVEVGERAAWWLLREHVTSVIDHARRTLGAKG